MLGTGKRYRKWERIFREELENARKVLHYLPTKPYERIKVKTIYHEGNEADVERFGRNYHELQLLAFIRSKKEKHYEVHFAPDARMNNRFFRYVAIHEIAHIAEMNHRPMHGHTMRVLLDSKHNKRP